MDIKATTISDFVKELGKDLESDDEGGAKKRLDQFLQIHNAKNIDDIRSYEDNEDLLNKKRVKWTPLHFASAENDEKSCQFLLDNGASISVETENFQTPLSIAAKYGVPASTKCLLKAIEKKANGDETERLKMVDHLSVLSRGTNKEKPIITPLLRACGKGDGELDQNRLETINLLLNAGANPKQAITRSWDNDYSVQYHTAVHMLLSSASRTTLDKEKTLCVIQMISSIINKIPESERGEFLSKRTKEKKGSGIRSLSTLDFAFHFGNKNTSPEQFQLWRKIQDILINFGAKEGSDYIVEEDKGENKSKQQSANIVSKVKAEIESATKRATFMRFLEISSVMGYFFWFKRNSTHCFG